MIGIPSLDSSLSRVVMVGRFVIVLHLQNVPKYRVNTDYTTAWEQISIVTLDAAGQIHWLVELSTSTSRPPTMWQVSMKASVLHISWFNWRNVLPATSTDTGPNLAVFIIMRRARPTLCRHLWAVWWNTCRQPTSCVFWPTRENLTSHTSQLLLHTWVLGTRTWLENTPAATHIFGLMVLR